jgi:hypothetical protein
MKLLFVAILIVIVAAALIYIAPPALAVVSIKLDRCGSVAAKKR